MQMSHSIVRGTMTRRESQYMILMRYRKMEAQHAHRRMKREKMASLWVGWERGRRG